MTSAKTEIIRQVTCESYPYYLLVQVELLIVKLFNDELFDFYQPMVWVSYSQTKLTHKTVKKYQKLSTSRHVITSQILLKMQRKPKMVKTVSFIC